MTCFECDATTATSPCPECGGSCETTPMPNPVGQPPAGGYNDPETRRKTIRMGSVLEAMIQAEAERRGVKWNVCARQLWQERLRELGHSPEGWEPAS